MLRSLTVVVLNNPQVILVCGEDTWRRVKQTAFQQAAYEGSAESWELRDSDGEWLASDDKVGSMTDRVFLNRPAGIGA